MDTWTKGLVVLCVVGIVVSAYLASDSIYPTVASICPSGDILNCEKVTSSPYSYFYGVPVAFIAIFWFAAMLWLGVKKPSFYVYVVFPLWLAGAIFAGYLIYVELFVLHAVCLYCTVAHVAGLLLIVPILAMLMGEDEVED